MEKSNSRHLRLAALVSMVHLESDLVQYTSPDPMQANAVENAKNGFVVEMRGKVGGRPGRWVAGGGVLYGSRTKRQGIKCCCLFSFGFSGVFV